MPEELTGSDFEAGSKTEMAFEGQELVTTADVVIVRSDPCVVREVMFASFAVLAGSRLDTGNSGRLFVCKQAGVENNCSLFICS